MLRKWLQTKDLVQDCRERVPEIPVDIAADGLQSASRNAHWAYRMGGTVFKGSQAESCLLRDFSGRKNVIL